MPSPRVAVLGAGGPTGALTVEALIESQTQTVAVVRDPSKYSGKWPESSLLTVMKGDVTNAESLKPALKGCTHVAFTASSSTYTGAKAVDYLGVKNAADASEAGSHIILVTSALVSPHNRFNPIRMLLNTVKWYLMDYKYQGEEVLRANSKVKHTILRPGGLIGGKAGELKIVVSQGDKKSWPGKIPRADVAAVILAAVNDPQADGKTVELSTDSEQRPGDNDLKHIFDSTNSPS